jgi:hypothetical protein
MKRVLPSALILGLLSACGSVKDANNTNFTKALDTHFARDCIRMPISGTLETSFPITISQTDGNDPLQKGTMAQLDALVKIGWLSEVNGTTTQPVFFGPKTSIVVPAKIYSLTAAGKAAVAPRGFWSAGHAFCIGHYTVDSITRFTQPQSDPSGMMVSEVDFTFDPFSDVPSWAYSTPVQAAFPNLANALQKSQTGDVTLVLTNKGWMDANDFSN